MMGSSLSLNYLSPSLESKSVEKKTNPMFCPPSPLQCPSTVSTEYRYVSYAWVELEELQQPPNITDFKPSEVFFFFNLFIYSLCIPILSPSSFPLHIAPPPHTHSSPSPLRRGGPPTGTVLWVAFCPTQTGTHGVVKCSTSEFCHVIRICKMGNSF